MELRGTKLADSREGLGVIALGGKLYAIGGMHQDSRAGGLVECFDPSTGQWSQAGAMGTARRGHSLAVGFAPLEVPMLQSERRWGWGWGAHTAGTGHRDRLV